MLRASEFHLPRRYNSLRLTGFDYSSTSALYLVSMKTELARPVFADITLAKQTLATLMNPTTQARLRIIAYALMPDHLHLVCGVKQQGKELSPLLGAFESFTTQVYWKRAREIVESQNVCRPPERISRHANSDDKQSLASLMEWVATLRPEVVALKNW